MWCVTWWAGLPGGVSGGVSGVIPMGWGGTRGMVTSCTNVQFSHCSNFSLSKTPPHPKLAQYSNSQNSTSISFLKLFYKWIMVTPGTRSYFFLSFCMLRGVSVVCKPFLLFPFYFFKSCGLNIRTFSFFSMVSCWLCLSFLRDECLYLPINSNRYRYGIDLEALTGQKRAGNWVYTIFLVKGTVSWELKIRLKGQFAIYKNQFSICTYEWAMLYCLDNFWCVSNWYTITA